jgi:serine/threonine protein kinase
MSAIPKNWETIKAVFERVLELDPQDRAAFLKNLNCDSSVREEVQRLLLEHSEAKDFLSTPLLADPPSLDGPRLRLSAGEVLAGRFKVVRYIAGGGMGEVYEAEDLELHEKLALKTIRGDFLNQPDSLSLFKREVHLARKVTHPNVCRVFDLFRHGSAGGEGIVFISMELLEGNTLAGRLKQIGRFGIDETFRLANQMAAGLSAAHQAGVIHRDFKPGNVILTPGGTVQGGVRVVVTDFGLAVRSFRPIASSDSTISSIRNNCAGTPAYMAPEQIEGQPATPASDIYSLGLVLYEMVTGELPFHASTSTSMALKKLTETPIPPRQFVQELSSIWEKTILRCLERNPANRFSRVEEVTAELAQGIMPSTGQRATFVETQTRVLDAAAPNESSVGRATEILAMVRELESRGLKEHLRLEEESSSSMGPENVRQRRFELEFLCDSSGQRRPAEIFLKLESPDFEPREQTKKLRVPPKGDSALQTFLVIPKIAGELVLNLELLLGEEVVVSRSIRMRAASAGEAISPSNRIISVPLTILVQTSPSDHYAPQPEIALAAGVKASSPTISPPQKKATIGALVLTILLTVSGSLYFARRISNMRATQAMEAPASRSTQTAGDVRSAPAPPIFNPAAPDDARSSFSGIDARNQDLRAIERLVHQYQQAYENEDLQTLKAIWPSIPKGESARLQTAFGHFDRIELTLLLTDQAIKISGSTADVVCPRFAKYIHDNKVEIEHNGNLELKLQKLPGDFWVVAAVKDK